MRIIYVVATAVLFMSMAASAQDDFTTKLYPVLPHIFAENIAPASTMADPFGGAGDPFGGGADPFGGGEDPFAKPAAGAAPVDSDPLATLGELAALPPGSELAYFPHWGQVKVRTSAEGHTAIKKVLETLNVPSPLITVDFTFMEIPSNVVTKSEVYLKSGSLDAAEVMRLFREGKTQLISNSKVCTLSGVNAQVEAVNEIIYPTEFVPPKPAKAGGPAVAGVQQAGDVAATPGSFETREAGHLLNVTPTLSPVDPKKIYLALIPETAILAGWVDFSAKGKEKIQMKREAVLSQPVFRSLNITTSVVVRDGEPVVVFGAPNPSTGDLIYGLVTARLSR